jgi:putative acetyltransferase
MSDLRITSVDPYEPDVCALLEASHALMEAMYPSEANNYLSLDALRAPHVTLCAAREGGAAALGCGAVAVFEEYAEIKSMFTSEAARGRGVADAVLRHLEDEVRAAGKSLILLETGTGLDAAHRLYHRHGFTTRGPFGDYEGGPYNVFMQKRIALG